MSLYNEKYTHGGEKYDKRVELDFSANINPFGMPESVIETLSDKRNISAFADYPDSKCTALRRAIAEKKGIPAENIFCGNGASDIIFRLAYAVKPHRTVLVSPCFSEYEKAVRSAGSNVSFYDTFEKNDFKVGKDLIDFIKFENPNMVFLCSPSNPVGVLIDTELLKEIADAAKEMNFILVLDECFGGFVSENRESMLAEAMNNKNVVVLDAFTKIYGMAGMRLGMMYSSNTEIIEKCMACGGSWNVSAPAQLAGIETLKCDDYVKKSVEYIHIQRKRLEAFLQKLGFKVFDGYANFIFFKAYDKLYEDMLENGVLIRQCGNYRGLGNEYYRIAVRTEEENNRFMEILSRIIGEKS